MPLPPSRRDITGPPPRNVSDLSKIVRHHESYLRSLDPGILGGRFATPKPLGVGGMEQLVDTSGGSDDTDIAWEWDDRHTVTATGTQTVRLSHYPIEESLFVRWHADSDGGLPWTNEHFTLTDNVVTIPDPGYLAVGDEFSFQYQYEIDDDVLDPAVVGFTAPGTWDSTALTVTLALPTGTASGDLLVASLRGVRAAGGGDITLDVTCSDPRITTVAHHVTGTVVEVIFLGFEDGSGSPLVINVVPNPSYTPSGKAGLASITGVNGYGTISAVDSGSTTPTVSGTAAVAVTWIGGTSFSTVNADPPTGYTNIGDTGTDYSSTCISWWYDPDGTTSPAGTFAGEGCCVIQLV